MKRMIPLLLIALLLLSACASGGGTAAPAAQTPETPAAAPEASQTPESPAPSPEPVSETPEIENSGGFFVRVGDEVYFRKYGPDALAKTALFARFTETYAATGEPSEIVAYDLNTGRLRTVFTDTGCGPLWYADGGFWLQETEGGELSIAWVSLDGKQERWYPEDTLLGVSDGGLAVAERYDYDGETSVHVFTLYKDLMPLAEYVTADHMTFAGVTDDALFLLRHDYDLEKYGAEPERLTLVQISADGKNTETVLGAVPEIEDPFSDGETDQFLVGDGEIGVVIGYYAGTMHALNECVIVRAVPGQADSLTVFDADVETPDDEWLPPVLYLTDGGELAAAAHKQGEVEIGWHDEDDGDLLIYDGGGWRTLVEDFCPSRRDGLGFEKCLQAGETVGGRVFTVTAAAHTSPIDDIGWREAYELFYLSCDVVPAEGGETEELCFIDCGGELEGRIWIARDRSAVLWQQTTDDPEAYLAEAYYAYLIYAAPDTVWKNADSVPPDSLFGAYDLPRADYYGCELPAGEGVPAVLKLDRDGNAVSVTVK